MGIILIIVLIVLISSLVSEQKKRAERVRMTRIKSEAQRKDSLRFNQAGLKDTKKKLRDLKSSPVGWDRQGYQILKRQYQADIGVYEANIRDLRQ
jgi:hypothetical protein